jgi:hypothetical protein
VKILNPSVTGGGMGFFGSSGSKPRRKRDFLTDDDSDMFNREMYSQAKDDWQLLLIYKKLEVAAKIGDWTLMNELTAEFRQVQSAKTESPLEPVEVG